ncbi:serine threonine- kinase roco5, partial, partial [Paramuricea clavata]
MDTHDITNQEIICTDMLVESQEVETNSKGNLSKISADLKDDDGIRQELVGTNTIITECTDIEKFCKVSSKMLPYEILARGEDGVNAFKTAVAKGTARASRLKMIVVGEVGAGKTSLTRSLCGEPFTDTREKTRGIRTASTSEPIIQTTKLDESWKHADPDVSHYDELIARNVSMELRQKLRRGNLPGLPSSGEFDLPQFLEGLTGTAYPGLRTPSLPIAGSQEHMSHVVTKPCVTIDNSPRKYPATLVATKLSCAASEPSSVKKIIWDFAGHQLYEPMHHVFMNSTSLYLVVFNLLKMRNSPEKSLCEIHYWLNSIASHTSSSTPVILVGTQSS